MEIGTVIVWIAAIVVVLFILGILLGSFFTVNQSEAAIVQRFGKFQAIASSGLNFKVPFIDSVVHTLSLKVQQLDTEVEAKTKDGTFITMPLSIQYKVVPTRVKEAFYNVMNPSSQFTALAHNVILGHIPALNLDEVYAQQSTIGQAITQAVNEQMEDYGYEIVKTLINDIVPSADVRASMNAVQAALRSQQAATAQGEADRIKLVAAANAEMESKILQGKGIAGERKAIIDGLKESVDALKEATGVDASEAMCLVLMTQYFDTLAKISENNQSSTILLPHSPGALPDFMDQIRNAITVGNISSQVAVERPPK